MDTNGLRNRYLDFFKGKAHKICPSDSLVPDDESLLFTSAGMNQFKLYFLGEKKDLRRAASCQRCLRTGDLERVGQTPYHHTFFEMLGNFSFGDYFKRETIEFAWEFLLRDLNMKPGNLWVSVYKDDDQAYKIWKDGIGLPPEKIVKLGEDSNFWPAAAPSQGPDGPCGPCSEIFFDWGEGRGCGRPECGPDCSCGRFVEIWNLVFTQFNRTGPNKLAPLPQKNIDTGMGLERMASVLQGKGSNFEIDILAAPVGFVRELLRIKDDDPAVRSVIYAIVDHARAATFAIADGIFPANEERGYVIRKLIRKALWQGTLLGRKKPFLYELPACYTAVMGEVYPYLSDKERDISQVIRAEEEKFLHTLRGGRGQLNVIIKGLKKEKKNMISAEDCFRLYDTYGFPLELTQEIARGEAMTVDGQGFGRLLSEQQCRSRQSSMFDENIFKGGEFQLSEVSRFVGYDYLCRKGKILRLFKDCREVKELSARDTGVIVLDNTPFYAAGGGQLADKGVIETGTGKFVVEEVARCGEAIIHKGRVANGIITRTAANACVDAPRRCGLMRAHSATHLLQAALRQVLGSHVTQQGSLVDVDRLRFDFTHFKALSREQLEQVEELVNEFILRAEEITKRVVPYQEAKKEKALAFFKDKYAAKVRVVAMGDYSKELCAGTHLENTSQIGGFSIAAESSISSGIRRIEAVVGRQDYFLRREGRRTLSRLQDVLRCTQEELAPAVLKLMDDLKMSRDKIDALEKENIASRRDEILRAKRQVKGKRFLVYSFPQKDYPILLYLSDVFRKKAGSIFLFLVSSYGGRDIFVCSLTDDYAREGVSVKDFIASLQKEVPLKGGGRDDLVQGVILRKDSALLEKVEKGIRAFLGRVNK